MFKRGSIKMLNMDHKKRGFIKILINKSFQSIGYSEARIPEPKRVLANTAYPVV